MVGLSLGPGMHPHSPAIQVKLTIVSGSFCLWISQDATPAPGDILHVATLLHYKFYNNIRLVKLINFPNKYSYLI